MSIDSQSLTTQVLEKGLISTTSRTHGLFNIKAAERYRHVKSERLAHIISLHDDIRKKGRIEG